MPQWTTRKLFVTPSAKLDTMTPAKVWHVVVFLVWVFIEQSVLFTNRNVVLICYCLSPAQALTIRPAMFLWPWSSSLLTSLRVFT